MSTICHGFVQNAWRKDICSNCFRVRDEHSETENSVKCSISETSGVSNNNNGVNIPAIVPRNNNNKKYGNDMNVLVVGGTTENIGPSQNLPQKTNRFLQGTSNPPVATSIINNNSISSSSSSAFGQQGSSSSIPRISNGFPTVGNGKFSGTNSNNNNTTSATIAATTTKGYHIHSGLSGSKSNINSDGGYNNNHNGHNDSSSQSETNVQTRNAEGTLTKTSSTSVSSHMHSNSNQPLIVMQQGKGVMTNQHPSKSDNGSVILNHSNNDNNNKQQAMTTVSSAAAAGVVSHLSSTTANTIGRSASSSYIASKNIFNNAYTAANGSSICTTGYSSSTTNGTMNSNCSKLSGSMNGNAVLCNVALASVAGSTGLSHPQSTNSIKRGNIVASSSHAFLSPSSSSSSSSSTQSQKFSCGSGTVVDPVVSSNYNGISGATSYSNRQSEDCDKNGVTFESNHTTLRETPEGAVVNFCTSLSKGAICITSQNGMNRSRVAGKPMEGTDGGDNILDRRKVGLSGVNSSSSLSGNSGQVKISNGTVGKPTSKNASKGILRSKAGHKKRDKNVRFPDEVVSVIGYGGGPSGMSDDEDDAPPDPLDSASVNEVMEKNSTTSEEKELHRVTQKNTNFNSIKTNLMGITCIEIGPIVGCSGGKSMEGSSKPLVSIGTFEARKEPLRIHKKITEDSADDELNEKTVEKLRKFTTRSSGGERKPPLPTTQAPTKANSMSNSNNTSQSSCDKGSEIAKQKQTTTVSTSRSVASGVNKTASSSSTTINSISSKTTVSSSKSSGSISTKNEASATLFTDNKGNGSSTGSSTTIEVNPEKTSSPCTINTTTANQSSKESVATLSSSSSLSTESSVKSKTSSSHSSGSTVANANRIISSSNTASNNSTSSTSTTKGNKWGNNNMTSCNVEGPSVRNKPVLKRIQQKDLSDSSEGYTVNTAVSDTNKSSSSNDTTDTAKLNGRNSNMINFTNGDKGKASAGNNNSIASKRSSFLRDIIIDSSSSSTTTTTIETIAAGDELNRNNGTSASSGGVQVICKNNNEQDSLMIKSELKVDLKPSVNNGKLSHPPFGECLSNRSNGTDDSSEFDDSLEDSGLDIKKCSEISESDEKSGSGSDSGNENDYSDRDRVNIIPTAGPKSGLFISVDEVEGTNKKPEKLSPDSVLFSSASEMSASGSSESIPEALDTVSNGSSDKSSNSSSSSNNGAESSGNVGGTTVNNVKRTAPRPPTSTVTIDSASKGNNGLYANSQASVATAEGIYDDVSFYKNPMHFPQNKPDNKITAFEEEDEEEENIYDDCTTISTATSKVKTGGKLAIGSYSFQTSSRNILDSDGDEEIEKVVHRRSDGIEFIGIRKIDSESFLRERSPTPERCPEGKRERSSSASPKTRRKVNQFFSTIGKKAGAAFSQHVHAYKNKSNSVIEDTGIEKSPSGSSSAYKRSLSTDEVSMTRTQEIYATLTPTSLKFKGLGPVLHKLSRMDLNMGDKDRCIDDGDGLDSKEKGLKKHKISSSIKKFLRFGSKDGSGETSGNKYDFGNCQTKTETNGSSQMITTRITEEGMTEQCSSRTPTPTKAAPALTANQLKMADRKPYGTVAARPPPPPPPRVHSLDLLNRVGVVPNGTVRPARPPPPARHNRVAPSFTAVFNNPNTDTEKAGGTGNDSSTSNQNYSDNPDPNNPPSKPKRKASMNLDCVTNGISRDLESTYNHITTLNLETLKLIASQTPMKIKRSANLKRRSSSQLKWSHFHILEPSKPLAQGHGFAFYSALLDDESCVLLIQESATAPNFSAPFEFPCVETSATFEDCIPDSYVTWKVSEYVTIGSSVKVFVSVMPKYNVYSVEHYMQSQVPLLHKYFALLQTMTYWDKEEMSNLLVLVQSMEESESHFMANATTRGNSSDTIYQPSSPSSVLVYVHPIPHLQSSSGHMKTANGRSMSKSQLCIDFENSMKQLLLNNNAESNTSLLGDNDRQVLMKRLCDRKAKTTQDQFRLFLQVKLFAPKRDSDELDRIKKLRSERAIQQWLDKERALCMKEAVEQTLQRNVESSISPYKRSYLEFLLTPENSAKAVLDMLIDLLE